MEQHIRWAEFLAGILDTKFGIGPFRFGLDPVIGFIPVLGDLIPLAVSLYLLWIAHRFDVPMQVRAQMVRNIIVDTVLGMIPFVGDVSDFFFKSNARNMALLRRHIPTSFYEGTVVSSRIRTEAGVH